MTNCKQFIISIPEDEPVPDIIHTFCAKENALMIRIGSDCIQKARIHLSNLSQEEVYTKMKNDSSVIVKTLELDLLVQKELFKQLKQCESERIDTEIRRAVEIYKENETQLNNKYSKLQETTMLLKEEVRLIESEKTVAIQQEISKEREKFEVLICEKETQYDSKYSKLQETATLLKEELRMIELEKTTAIQQEISKEREKFDMLLGEKNRELTRMNDNYEKIAQNTNKTSTLKGIDGERVFSEIASTFKDFKGFEIIDKTKQSGEGDFYLKFEEFDILADAKNYKKSVPSSEREKIKMDLIKNEHIHFAWLVSLNTTIDKFDKSPIMFEWVNTQKCIVYINQLLHYENPSQILRIAWFTCRELFKLVKEEHTDITELTSLREKQYKMTDKIKNIRKIIRELNTTIGLLKKQVDTIDYELKDILEVETADLVDSNFSLFDDWWKLKIENTSSLEQKLKSTDIWTKFKQDNKEIMKQFQIAPEKFKQYIKSILPLSSYDIRSNNGAFDIKGIVWKSS